jgi:hypothetical protein
VELVDELRLDLGVDHRVAHAAGELGGAGLLAATIIAGGFSGSV